MSNFLYGNFVLYITDKRRSNDTDRNTNRYISKVIYSEKHPEYIDNEVTVKFKHHSNARSLFYYNIGNFDGQDNDIQSDPLENIRENRRGHCNFNNPFIFNESTINEGMSKALNAKMEITKASEAKQGIYFCYNCFRLVLLIRPNNGEPYFRHYPKYNPECKLSSSEGEWGDSLIYENKDGLEKKHWNEAIDECITSKNISLLSKNIDIFKTHIENYISDCKIDEHKLLIKKIFENIENKQKNGENIGSNVKSKKVYKELLKIKEIKSKNMYEFFNQACYFFYQSDYNSAIQNFIKFIDLNDDDHVAVFNRGLSYYKNKQYDNAIKDFNKSISLKSNFSFAYYHRGIIHYLNNNFYKAIEDFDKANQYLIPIRYLDNLYEYRTKALKKCN
jgi:tetratricopeptide (TPR) repeat protein